MKILKNILNWFVFLLTGNGDLATEYIEMGAVDYSGQGKDKYGN